MSLAVVSALNSSSTPLGAGAEFVGSVEEGIPYSDLSVFVFSDAESETDGLKIQWSSDGVNFDDSDSFTFNPGAQGSGNKIFTFGIIARFFRVRYLNGASPQSAFRLQTILHAFPIKPSSHRLEEDLLGEADAQLMRTVITGRDPLNGIYKNAGVSGLRFLTSNQIGGVPVGTTSVKRPGNGLITLGSNETVDDFYTITNGKTLTLLRMKVNCQPTGNTHARVELFEDPNGDESVLNSIETMFGFGNNDFQDFNQTFVGDGTRRIILRATHVGGGSIEIDRQWEGFEE